MAAPSSATTSSRSAWSNASTRLTQNGRSVERPTARICSRSAGSSVHDAPRQPMPPAADTAATSSGLAAGPMGACITGTRQGSCASVVTGCDRTADVNRRQLLQRAAAIPIAGGLAACSTTSTPASTTRRKAAPRMTLADLEAELRGPLLRRGTSGYATARVISNERYADVLPQAIAVAHAVLEGPGELAHEPQAIGGVEVGDERLDVAEQRVPVRVLGEQRQVALAGRSASD